MPCDASESAAPRLSAAPEPHWLEGKAEAESALNIFSSTHHKTGSQHALSDSETGACSLKLVSVLQQPLGHFMFASLNGREQKKALQHASELTGTDHRGESGANLQALGTL